MDKGDRRAIVMLCGVSVLVLVLGIVFTLLKAYLR